MEKGLVAAEAGHRARAVPLASCTSATFWNSRATQATRGPAGERGTEQARALRLDARRLALESAGLRRGAQRYASSHN
jgi:hypothetical protein